MPPLVALLSGESDSSYHAVQAVAQFAADERYRATLAESGGMEGLTPLLASHLPHIQQVDHREHRNTRPNTRPCAVERAAAARPPPRRLGRAAPSAPPPPPSRRAAPF